MCADCKSSHGSPFSVLWQSVFVSAELENYNLISLVGADDGEGPPVPIPNTEVKLTGAEDTWLVTARDNRKVPTQIFLNSSAGRACGC